MEKKFDTTSIDDCHDLSGVGSATYPRRYSDKLHLYDQLSMTKLDIFNDPIALIIETLPQRTLND